jgi:Lrp/AsnC family leucine-responsive transcriptional regulator
VQRKLAASLIEIPEVERVDIVTGSTDLVVRLHVRDQAHLNDLLFDSLLSSSEIRHTETYLALATLEPDNFSSRLLQDVAAELVERLDTRP